MGLGGNGREGFPLLGRPLVGISSTSLQRKGPNAWYLACEDSLGLIGTSF